ncbi:MAG TPA: glycosyltransferase WbuB [Legionellales bacterium]|nr:glycosyltransferase WbuB [Legionellales bacterium]HCA89408.1 glycosyltransferase WbuB [Legionellales bacterium]|tara:strand:+ start:1275 stop:2507 length:1233 start_codon:yes stop_codon:yes gene_type:complete
MNILLVTQYFWPEHFIINDLVKCLNAKGHTCKILTGQPNYPDGITYPGYKADACHTDTFVKPDDVFRIPLRPRGQGMLNLIRNYLSFIINGWRYFPKAIKDSSFDVMLFMGVSPITSAIPAIYLKRKYKLHLALWVQDLWPESLSATGYVKHPWLLKLVGQLVKKIYAQSDTILVQSQAFIEAIKPYTTLNKVIYYPNSYPDLYTAASMPLSLSHAQIHELKTHFCVVFAGNVGQAQAIETWVKAASLLTHLPDIRLIIVGTGSCMPHLTTLIEQKNLTNIKLLGRLPHTQMIHLYQYSAALLVTLRKNKALAATIPSKIQAYMAASRPLIGALDGAGNQLICEARAGLTCAAEDGVGLADCIMSLYRLSPEQRQHMGEAARTYFLKHFELNNQSDRLISIFSQRLGISL